MTVDVTKIFRNPFNDATKPANQFRLTLRPPAYWRVVGAQKAVGRTVSESVLLVVVGLGSDAAVRDSLWDSCLIPVDQVHVHANQIGMSSNEVVLPIASKFYFAIQQTQAARLTGG